MDETNKSSIRRSKDYSFVMRYFVGSGIDIGAGKDSLAKQMTKFPGIVSVRSWDFEDGDAQYLEGVASSQFDFVYSSHCLEHMQDPTIALQNWLRVLKPGGYLIVTVPDEDLYEHGQWPSLYNNDHRWSFTISKIHSVMPKSLQILRLCEYFGLEIDCERIALLKDHYVENSMLGDQTLGLAECAIEFVWRKKILSYEDWLRAGQYYEQNHNFNKAVFAFVAAMELESSRFDAYNQLTNLLARCGDLQSADHVWQRCVAELPMAYESHFFRALFLISTGRYDEGFHIRDQLVSDQRRTPITPPVNYPRWQGQSLQKKSIIIWTEFGLGDELMFARFVLIFKKMGATRVSILCQKPLTSLLKCLMGVDAVFSDDQIQEIPEHDYWVFPHSIPVFYSLNKHGIPSEFPYIQLAPHLSDSSLQLPDRKKQWLRVGLVYQGNSTHENDRLRSIFDLNVLSSLFELPYIHWVILQKQGPEKFSSDFAEVLSIEGVSINFVGDQLDNFLDSANICAQLDLIISVDTSVAHLAGAMNIPVWLLLPTYADWRWGVMGDHSPWYASIILFRQVITGNWSEPVAAIRKKLTEWSRTKIPLHKI